MPRSWCVGVVCDAGRMSEGGHQIVALRFDDDAGCALWRCRCGYDSDGYDSVGEARYAAAEHQLPEPVQRELEGCGFSIEAWRDAVVLEADAAASEAPQAWRWYRDSAALRTD